MSSNFLNEKIVIQLIKYSIILHFDHVKKNE